MTPSANHVIVIGAGMAGASVAYALALNGRRVVMLERESQPGYHATGRSAAHWISSYGPPGVRAWTRASRQFLLHPPEGFTDVPLMRRRATLEVAAPGQQDLLDAAWQLARETTPDGARLLSADEACVLVPVLRPERTIGAVWQPDAFDIDVHALHQGLLRAARRLGGQFVGDAEVVAIERGAPASSSARAPHAVPASSLAQGPHSASPARALALTHTRRPQLRGTGQSSTPQAHGAT